MRKTEAEIKANEERAKGVEAIAGSNSVNRGLFDALDTKTDQAALFVHEVLYAMSREKARSNQAVSLPARRIVAYLFSNLDRPELLKGLVKAYLSKKDSVGLVAALPSSTVDAIRLTHSLENIGRNQPMNSGSWIKLDGQMTSDRGYESQPMIATVSSEAKVRTIEIFDGFVDMYGTWIDYATTTTINIDGEETSFEKLIKFGLNRGHMNERSGLITLIPGLVTDYLYGRL